MTATYKRVQQKMCEWFGTCDKADMKAIEDAAAPEILKNKQAAQAGAALHGRQIPGIDPATGKIVVGFARKDGTFQPIDTGS